MEVGRMKRPLEAVDANAASSNSTSTGTSSDKHTGAPRKKKKKSASRSIDAVLPRAQDVSLSMLPSPQARRKTIDQSIIARGSVERVHHDESSRTISFFLVSTSTSNNLYAELPVVVRGELIGSASLKLLLHEHASMVLTFKEASLGSRIPSSTLSNPSFSHASSALFDRYLCFDRGMEFWVSLTSVSAASTSGLPGASSQWTHYRKFANAQQTSQNAAPQSLRGPSAPQASPKKAITSEARAREEAGGSGRMHPPSTLPGSMDQVQMQNALLTLFRDSGEAAERPAVLPPSGGPGPSPESGITHIEAGPTQEVDQEDGQEENQEKDANIHLILENQPNQPVKAEADANANARLVIRNLSVKEEVGIDASLVFTNQSVSMISVMGQSVN